MKKCKVCGSYAINHHLYDRDGTDLDLCDVHYWMKRAKNATLKAIELETELKSNSVNNNYCFDYKTTA